MASNPMQRKARTSFLLGMLVMLVIAGAVIAFLFTFVLKIFCGATLGNLSINNEKVRAKITTQEKENESLTMQVNELTSFDYVKEVVKEMGLAYNNDNILVVNE